MTEMTGEVTVTVELRGPLARYGRDRGESGTFAVKIAGGTSVAGLLGLLGLPREYVSLIIVSGRKAEALTGLEEGDTVLLFPPVAGG